jgi:hypothetical protein
LRRIYAYIPALVIPLFLPILSASADTGNRTSKNVVFMFRGHESIGIPPPDSTLLKYPFTEKNKYPFSNSGNNSPLYLKDPSNIKSMTL